MARIELYLFRVWSDLDDHALCEDGSVIGWDSRLWGVTSSRARRRDDSLACGERFGTRDGIAPWLLFSRRFLFLGAFVQILFSNFFLVHFVLFYIFKRMSPSAYQFSSKRRLICLAFGVVGPITGGITTTNSCCGILCTSTC